MPQQKRIEAEYDDGAGEEQHEDVKRKADAPGSDESSDGEDEAVDEGPRPFNPPPGNEDDDEEWPPVDRP
jgi:hypothetical protein